MVSGQAAFYEIRVISPGARQGEILATDLWVKPKAIEEAKKLGKKHKLDVAVFQTKQVFATDTGEFNIVF